MTKRGRGKVLKEMLHNMIDNVFNKQNHVWNGADINRDTVERSN